MSDEVQPIVDRKPIPQTKEPAQVVLNRFLKENNILIGTETPRVEFTQQGSMIIHAPKVIAVYGEPKADDTSN